MAQFNWKTNSPAAGARTHTQAQMDHVLRDLLVSGGTVYAAMHKVTVLPGAMDMRLMEAQLGENGFIAGDEAYFWTADGREYDLIDESWVLRTAEGKKSKKEREDLKKLEDRYPIRNDVVRVRTWAGPIMSIVQPGDYKRLPAHPTSSRPWNRGVKRKQDDGDGDGNQGQPGNDGDPPVTGDNTKPPPKGKRRKPPPRKGKGKGKAHGKGKGKAGKHALYVVAVYSQLNIT